MPYSMFSGGHGFFNSGQLRFEDVERFGHSFPSIGGPHIDKFDPFLKGKSTSEYQRAC